MIKTAQLLAQFTIFMCRRTEKGRRYDWRILRKLCLTRCGYPPRAARKLRLGQANVSMTIQSTQPIFQPGEQNETL